MNIAILGCGPSGLLAAHAAEQKLHNVTIYSHPVKSEINGAMFMHEAIPGLSDPVPDFSITIIKSGVREGYAENVYGRPDAPVSWDKFQEGEFPAWDLRAVYTKLWDAWEKRILEAHVGPAMMESLLQAYDRVISTVPARVICAFPFNHHFRAKRIWIERMEGGLIPNVNDNNLMYYNGYTPDGKYRDTIGPKWYRYCQINGLRSWEYAKQTEGENVVQGYKPIETDCDCWPQIIKLGRYGAWQKQILTHHVYRAAYNAL